MQRNLQRVNISWINVRTVIEDTHDGRWLSLSNKYPPPILSCSVSIYLGQFFQCNLRGLLQKAYVLTKIQSKRLRRFDQQTHLSTRRHRCRPRLAVQQTECCVGTSVVSSNADRQPSLYLDIDQVPNSDCRPPSKVFQQKPQKPTGALSTRTGSFREDDKNYGFLSYPLFRADCLKPCLLIRYIPYGVTHKCQKKCVRTHFPLHRYQ